MTVYIVMGVRGPVQAFAEHSDALDHKDWCKSMFPRCKYWIETLKLNYGQVM